MSKAKKYKKAHLKFLEELQSIQVEYLVNDDYLMHTDLFTLFLATKYGGDQEMGLSFQGPVTEAIFRVSQKRG